MHGHLGTGRICVDGISCGVFRSCIVNERAIDCRVSRGCTFASSAFVGSALRTGTFIRGIFGRSSVFGRVLAGRFFAGFVVAHRIWLRTVSRARERRACSEHDAASEIIEGDFRASSARRSRGSQGRTQNCAA